MKAILSKSLIPAALVIAALVAGTGLLAGDTDRPSQCSQATVQANCDGCPLQGTEACPKTECCPAGQCEGCPLEGTEACPKSACACPAPCCGVEECPMPCCPKTDGPPAAGCMMAKPQATGCPFAEASGQAVGSCGTGGCTQQK